MSSNVLVVGYGSIGKKHASAFTKLNCRVAVVSEHSKEWPLNFQSLDEAFELFTADYVIIASKTSDHKKHLNKVLGLGFQGKVLVEKPLFQHSEIENPKHADIFVGYNLRFHPCITFLRNELKENQAVSVTSYCGQFLPEWRPGTDYRECYSAKKNQGGGVLRDLSHELDIFLLLFGSPIDVYAVTKKMSSLEIDCEDNCSALMMMDTGSVVLFNLNYMDRNKRRFLIINSNENTYEVDLIRSTVLKNKESISLPSSIASTYELQANDLINNQGRALCGYGHGNKVMKLIDRIERAAS